VFTQRVVLPQRTGRDLKPVSLFVHSELMKEDYGEIQHKKSEVFHLCNCCKQLLEKTEQL